jgi:hypothetical protein
MLPSYGLTRVIRKNDENRGRYQKSTDTQFDESFAYWGAEHSFWPMRFQESLTEYWAKESRQWFMNEQI